MRETRARETSVASRERLLDAAGVILRPCEEKKGPDPARVLCFSVPPCAMRPNDHHVAGGGVEILLVA